MDTTVEVDVDDTVTLDGDTAHVTPDNVEVPQLKFTVPLKPPVP